MVSELGLRKIIEDHPYEDTFEGCKRPKKILVFEGNPTQFGY